MDIVVDEMGNCWADDDDEHVEPVMPHPELEGAQQRCPCHGKFVFRVRVGHDRFEWRCPGGNVLEDWHH